MIDTLQEIKDALYMNYDVAALILKGSLAKSPSETDEWSDIDVTIVVRDESLEKFTADYHWLPPLGCIFAFVKHLSDQGATWRICYDDFERVDFVVQTLSSFIRSEQEGGSSQGDPRQLLFVRDQALENNITPASKKSAFTPLDYESGLDMINRFWYRGVMAAAKMARGDYLIGSHLALENAQDCIVLQMLIRDHEKGTNIHRYGDCELVEVLQAVTKQNMPHEIIDWLEQSGMIFDKLAKRCWPQYEPRFEQYQKLLNTLKETLKSP